LVECEKNKRAARAARTLEKFRAVFSKTTVTAVSVFDDDFSVFNSVTSPVVAYLANIRELKRQRNENVT